MGVSGLILAGGKATRMEGANKALIPFLSRPMISHVIERLLPQVDDIIINANQEAEAFSSFHLAVLSDEVTGYAGPLAGLHTGLKASQHEWVLCVPCDSPLLPKKRQSKKMRISPSLKQTCKITQFFVCAKNL
jgi:molybdenum cofactor guanylyltransferase